MYVLGTNRSVTSDEIKLNSRYFDYKNHLRDYFWPYLDKTGKAWDWGVTVKHANGEAAAIPFSGESGSLALAWHYSKSDYILGKVGRHRLTNDATKAEESRSNYEFEAGIGDTETWRMFYQYSDDYVYQLFLQPAGIKEYLNAQRHRVGTRWNPVRLLKLEVIGSQWNLSDENIRRSVRFDADLRLSREWIWLGVTYEKMGYQDKRADYWTPQTFRSYGVSFDASLSLARKLTANLSGAISNIKEDNYHQGRSDSLTLGVDYKPVDGFALRYSFFRNKSQQNNSRWSERSYFVSINGIF